MPKPKKNTKPLLYQNLPSSQAAHIVLICSVLPVSKPPLITSSTRKLDLFGVVPASKALLYLKLPSHKQYT